MKKNDFLRLSCAAQMRMARIIVLVVCLLCVATYNIHAQGGYTVTGTVVDVSGEPLAGVSVVQKGETDKGTMTDVAGKYSLQVSGTGVTLTFSYIGFIAQDIVVSGNILNVTLKEDLLNLDEVVVVGYGAQKKVDLTGAVVAVKGAEVVKSPMVLVTNSLAGRLPGVIINNRSAEPGKEGTSILIRGQNTTGNNSPLILIDGVERSDLGQINSNDIESISVLKDASAAIYGARAANGVLLVTTKRGSLSKPSITFSYNQGFTQATRRPIMADSYTFAKVYNEIEENDGRAPRYTAEELEKFRTGSDPDNYPNTDWYDFIMKKATPQHQSNISVSGGSERVKYYLSVGEITQDGQYRYSSTKLKQYNVRSNIDVKATDNLTVGLNLAGRYDDKHYPWDSDRGWINSHIYLYHPMWQPFWPGTNYMTPNRDNQHLINLVSDNGGSRDTDIKTIQTTLSLKWDIPWIKGLSVDGSGSYDAASNFTKTFQKPTYVYYKNATTGALEEGLSGGTTAMANLTDRADYYSMVYFIAKINYDRTFGLHHVGAMLAYEQAQTKNNYFYASRSDFVSTAIPQLFAGSSDKSKHNNSGSAGQGARQNYFGRINYEYAGKYLVQFTLRRDGSPNFPENKRFGYFPSASVGWRLSEESFMKNINFVNNLKIRSSYGVMGNDQVNAFQYLTSYGFGNNYVIGNNDVIGLVQSSVPNPNITWETAKTWDVGLESSLWNGLFGIEFDVFKTRRSDILRRRNAVIPTHTGLSLPDENIGIVENRGFELILSHDNTVKDFTYRLSGNMSLARNKVVFIDEAPGAEPYQLATGRPMDSRLIYNAIGIFRDENAIENYPHFLGARPGDIIYEDANKDGTLDSRDRIRIDDGSVADIVFGFSANVSYKNFELSILLHGQENTNLLLGRGKGNTGDGWFPIMSPSFGNYPMWRANDRWSAENPDGTMPRGDAGIWTNNTESSTHWLADAGFLRLKNLELGYNLPQEVCRKLRMQNLRFSVSGSNLFLIYDHLKDVGLDPEGDAFWLYAPQRIYSIGVSLTF
jgi:TonB-linked SusC/RagA family outer membrane protein